MIIRRAANSIGIATITSRFRWRSGYGPALTVALVAAIYLIGRRSMWLDEANSWYFSSLPLSAMFDAERRQDSVFLVYYLALHFWQAFGHSAIVLRLFSLLFALAAIPFVYLLAQRLFGNAVSITASVLLALNTAYLYYATEARPYAAVFFFSAAAMYVFVCIACDGRYRLAPWYVAACAAAIYMHPLAILLPVAQAFSLIVLRPQRTTVMVFAACFATLAIAAMPMFWLATHDSTAQIAWIAAVSPATIRLFGEGLAGTAPLALVLTALVVIAIWNGRREASLGTALLLLWALVPIALGVLISIVQHVFIARYFLYTLIPLTILSAYALVSLRNLAARVVAIAAVVLATGHGLWSLARYQVEDWRASVAFIHEREQRGDVRVVYVPFQTVPYRYAYSERTGHDDTAILYPKGMLTGDTRTTALPANVLQEFRRRRVWVVYSRAHRIGQTPLGVIYRYARPVLQHDFTGVTVLLFTPR